MPPSTIAKLLEYFHTQDERSDIRPDVQSKHPRWGIDTWPEDEVKDVLGHALDLPYEVEEIILHSSRIHYPLHVDSGLGADQQDLYKVVLIPLHIEGPCGTLFFANHWTGKMSKFKRSQQYEYEYRLDDVHGGKTFVPDIRELKRQAEQDPGSIKDFAVTPEFINTLTYLIDARSEKKMNKQNAPVSNYQDVADITDQPFPEEIRQKHCQHINPEDLHGLSFDCYVEWNLGDAIVFDRTQIHSAAHGEIGKIGLTIFTNKCAG